MKFYRWQGYWRRCPVCNKEFVAGLPSAIYCSGNCRVKAWNRRHAYKRVLKK